MGPVRNSALIRPAIAAAALILGAGLAEPSAAQVSGRVSVTDAGGRQAPDLGDAVIYLDGRGPRGAAPARPELAVDSRQFRPRVLVVPAGTTVGFPNSDPFNHNVFSLSEPNAFDLGLYGRGETRSRRFARAGLVRVHCNIHPRMSAFIVVRDNGYYAQPGAAGSFTIPGVPPGRYTLHVWHERVTEVTQEITVPAGGLAGVEVALDASGYRWVQHRNKYGQEYGSGSQRERY
jgi:plastocyanin